MKKLLAVIILLLVAGPAFAAGTVTCTSDTTQNVFGVPTIRTVVLTCVGDASNGTIPDTTLYNIAGMSSTLKGWYLVRIKTKSVAADANVTDDSDVYLKDADGIDLLNGQGVDQLDDSTVNYIRLSNYDPIVDNPVLDVDNQSVVSGKYTITLIFGI